MRAFMTWPHWRDVSWARKLAALLLALAIIPIAAVTLFNEASIRDEFVRESHARNVLRAQNTAALIARYVDDVVGDVTVLARAPVTARVMAEPGDPVGLAELRLTMESLRQTRHIEVLQVLDHGGTVVASTRAAFVGSGRADAPYFRSALAGLSRVQDPRYQPDDAAEHINVAVPVRDDAGRVTGVAVARVPLDDIDRLVAADTNFGSLDEFGLLFDEQGIVISSPAHPEQRFHPLAPLDPAARARIVDEGRFGPDTARWIDAPGDARALAERARNRRRDPAADPTVDVPFGGERLQASTIPVADTRWTYAVVMPDSKLMAAIGRQRTRGVVVAGATALIALLIAGAFASWLSRPLSQMQDAARAIASGDLSRRTGVTGRDEVGRLAAAFDAMADSLAGKDAELRRHAESLERRVEERTAELSGLLQAVPDLIFKVSAGGVLLDRVAAQGEQPTSPNQRLQGRPLSEIMPPHIAAMTLERIQRALAGEPVEPFEYFQPGAAGDRRYEARISPSGRDTVVILVRDVTERRRNDDRTRFLARAAESLALSLDYGSTIETLARLPIPFLADLCIVDLLDRGQVRVGAVAASNPEIEARATAVRAKYPLALDAHHPSTVAMRSGPKLFRDCTRRDVPHVRAERRAPSTDRGDWHRLRDGAPARGTRPDAGFDAVRHHRPRAALRRSRTRAGRRTCRSRRHRDRQRTPLPGAPGIEPAQGRVSRHGLP